MGFDKRARRQKIRYRIRNKIKGTAQRPRLSVYRSNREIYCQVIDDLTGSTLVSASTMDEGIDKTLPKKDQANKVGQLIAEKAKAAKLENVVFDRSGYLYHGRIKALAEGAREGGLKF